MAAARAISTPLPATTTATFDGRFAESVSATTTAVAAARTRTRSLSTPTGATTGGRSEHG